jgi:preprotein translocase subunit YajC
MTSLSILPALLLGAQAPGDTMLRLIVPYALVFAIFYFILIRPQQRQRKQHEETIQNLKKGDEIVTAGGIIGRVVHVKETLKDGQPVRSMDDAITIESGSSRLIVERGRIAKIRGAAGAATTTA